MPRQAPAFLLIAAIFGFTYAAPRLFGDNGAAVLTLALIAGVVIVLARTGHVSRPDPLSLNLTARRPYWETRPD